MAITEIGGSQSFGYTGNIQSITIPYDGIYKLEVYGASGGAGGDWHDISGGKGGYSVGYKQLTVGQVLYVCCGGAGDTSSSYATDTSYNGGGKGQRAEPRESSYVGGGGGATHIATVSGVLSSLADYKDSGEIFIVAGGGGGAGGSYGSGGAGGGADGGGSSFGKGATGIQAADGGGGGGGGWAGGSTSSGKAYGGTGYIGGVPEFTYESTTYSPETISGQRSGNGKAVITFITDTYDYTITYENIDSTVTFDTLPPIGYYTNGDIVTLPIPTKNFFEFGGWYETEDFSTDPITEIPAGSTGNKVLYAKWIRLVWGFDYTGDIQTFTAPWNGLYKLEVYGAQGGNGGKGGYSTGYIHLDKDIELYIGVGGEGKTSTTNGASIAGGYNGGGSVTKGYSDGHTNKSGGGATHIAKTTNRGVLSQYSDNKDEILIVAGGGGGGTSGTGGGVTGGNGTVGSSSYAAGKGGSQTAGGSGYKSGSFGKGGNAQETYGVGAGGGGWYGGGGGGAYNAGGGGSGYIDGVPTIIYRNTSYVSSTENGVREGDGHAVITPIAKDLLFYFNGNEVEELIFNGVTIDSLVFNGTALF